MKLNDRENQIFADNKSREFAMQFFFRKNLEIQILIILDTPNSFALCRVSMLYFIVCFSVFWR